MIVEYPTAQFTPIRVARPYYRSIRLLHSHVYAPEKPEFRKVLFFLFQLLPHSLEVFHTTSVMNIRLLCRYLRRKSD